MPMIRHLSSMTLCLVLALLPTEWAVASGQVYRYINDSGVPVIDDRVPPKFVPKGYDVLDAATLSVIKRIPRQLTDEELQDRSSDEAKARMRAEEEGRLRAWDESLLVRYSSIDDIRAAQERAVKDLRIRISILKSNLISIKSQIEREQQKAADFERRGGSVPEQLAKNIEIMHQEIEDTEQAIAIREEEVAEVNASFERDIARFETLADRVNMRRKGASSAGK